MGRIAVVFRSAEDAEAAIHLLRDQLGLDGSWLARARLGAAGTPQDGVPLLGLRVPRELEERAVELIHAADGEIVEVTRDDVGGGA